MANSAVAIDTKMTNKNGCKFQNLVNSDLAFDKIL